MLAALLSLVLVTVAPAPAALTPASAGTDACAEVRPDAGRAPSGPAAWARRLDQVQAALQCYRAQPEAPPAAVYLQKLRAHEALDENAQALETAALFLDRYRTTADSSQLQEVHTTRGWIYFYDGNLSGAATNLNAALDYAQAAPPAARVDLITSVAYFFQRVRDFDTAQQHYQQAKAVLRAADPARQQLPTAWAGALINEADFLLATSGYTTPDTARIRQSAEQAERALRLLPQGTNPSRQVHAYTLMGEASGMLGQFERGRAALQNALQVARTHDLPGWYSWALLKLGRLHLMADDLAAAERVFTEARQRAEDDEDQDRVRRLHATFGLLYAKAGNPARAAASFRAANRMVEAQRATLRTTNWSASYFSVWSWTYRARARNLFLDGRYEEAFQTLAQMRARHLQDLQMQALLTRELPPEKRARYDSLTTALSDVRDRLAEGVPSAEQAQLKRREVQLTTERSAITQLDTARTALSLGALQQRLRAQNQTLVTYFIDRGSPLIQRPVQSFAFVVTPDTLHAVPLEGTQPAYQELMAAVSPLLADATEATTVSATRFDLGALHRLHQQLYAPVAPHVAPEARLVVVPDGPLFRLPMGMLVTEPVGRFDYPRAAYLAEQHPISYALSSPLLDTRRTSRAAAATDLVAFGRSTFADAPAADWTGLPVRTASTGSGEAAAQPSARTSGLPDLPGVATEFDRLGDLFKRTQLRLNDSATETAFYADASEAQIVHLASHALVQPRDPLQNAFALAPDDANDGLLYLHEILSRHRSIPLVTLSGCGTAQGTFYDGEGLRGMQYAFRATGAQSTLSTLWALDDEAAIALTTAFYRHLRAGHPKDAALQHAQMEYLRTRDRKLSPFYWASSVLYGSPAPLALSAPAPAPILPVAGAALLLLVAGLAYARYRSSRHA